MDLNTLKRDFAEVGPFEFRAWPGPTSAKFVGFAARVLQNLVTSGSAKNNANLYSIIYDMIYNKGINNEHTKHRVRLETVRN